MALQEQSGQQTQLKRLEKSLEAFLGKDVFAALADERVTDLMANPDGSVWLERQGEGLTSLGSPYPCEADRMRVITTVAKIYNKVINDRSPVLQCEMPFIDGRFQAWVSPAAEAPAFVVRKHVARELSLEDYLADGILNSSQLSLLKTLVRERKNILIFGGTGSGKTTLVNALINEAVSVGNSSERYVLLEDTYELRCAAKNRLHLHTAEDVTLLDLTQTAMRARPDRIIVGEVRGAEAHALVKVWNTGHPGGMATIHASCPQSALRRLKLLCDETGNQIAEEFIAQTVGAVVGIAKKGSARTLTHIATLKGYQKEDSAFIFEHLDNTKRSN